METTYYNITNSTDPYAIQNKLEQLADSYDVANLTNEFYIDFKDEYGFPLELQKEVNVTMPLSLISSQESFREQLLENLRESEEFLQD